jgi:hypothetical protein
MVSNMYFCSCDKVKNDTGHAVPVAEMRNAYRLVTENVNARDQLGDCGGRILFIIVAWLITLGRGEGGQN